MTTANEQLANQVREQMRLIQKELDLSYVPDLPSIIESYLFVRKQYAELGADIRKTMEDARQEGLRRGMEEVKDRTVTAKQLADMSTREIAEFIGYSE